jgi:hypothetical protein
MRVQLAQRWLAAVAVVAVVSVGGIAACSGTGDPRPGREGEGGVPGTAPQQTTNYTQDQRGETDLGPRVTQNPNRPPTP